MAEKFNKLTTKQMIQLSDKLRQICHLNPSGYAEYDAGWSDQRVVDEGNGEYTVSNVQGLRQDTIGSIRKSRTTTPGSFKSLEERVERLENWARSRPVQPFGKPIGSGK